MIPRQTIEEIKARTDIVELIGSYLPLKRAGGAFKACCPFHKEKTPSFQVNPQRQIYHCFGCGKGGGVIQFLMDYEGLDFISALKQLAERVNVPLEFEEGGFAAGRRDEKAKLLKIHELIAAHFHHLLREAPEAAEARAYLASRNLDEETIKRFHFGFAPERWDVVEAWGATQHIPPEDLAAAGLLVKSDRPGASPYYDRFRNRLMIPIRDEQGRVIAFTGRILTKDDQNAKYVNSPETILFQKSRVLFALDLARRSMADRKHAILCEGQIDAIRCHQAGFTNTIASQGTAITEAHARIIKRYCDDVILVLDPDSAGQNAALRAYEVFLEHDLNVRVARLPEGEDPDSLISSAGPTPFQHALDTAVSALTFQIQTLQARQTDQGPASLARTVRALLETIQHAPGEVLRDALMRQAATELDVREAAIIADFHKLQPLRQTAATPRPRPGQALPPRKPRISSAPDETALAELLLTGQPDLCDLVEEFLPLEDLADTHCREIIRQCLEQRDAPTPPTVECDEHSPEELVRLGAELQMAPNKLLGDEASPERAAKNLILNIRRKKLETTRKEVKNLMFTATGEKYDLLLLQHNQLTEDIFHLRKGWNHAQSVLQH